MQKDRRWRGYGLGSASDVPLVEAHEIAMALRRQVREGADPVAERRVTRRVILSFETVARKCYNSLRAGWQNRRQANWISSFCNRVFPTIGAMTINAAGSVAVVGWR